MSSPVFNPVMFTDELIVPGVARSEKLEAESVLNADQHGRDRAILQPVKAEAAARRHDLLSKATTGHDLDLESRVMLRAKSRLIVAESGTRVRWQTVDCHTKLWISRESWCRHRTERT